LGIIILTGRTNEISMKKDKNTHEKHEQPIKPEPETEREQNIRNGYVDRDMSNEEESPKVEESIGDELEEIRSRLGDKTRQCDEYYGMLQRIAAEFDNYKKRTAKEKETIYSDAVADVAAAFLPVVDNFERALQVQSNDNRSLKEGIELVFRQLQDVLRKLEIEEIKGVGEKFDPQLHNAVMHVTDEAYGEGIIIEEFQKGYVLKDKVIRHSLVKVAN